MNYEFTSILLNFDFKFMKISSKLPWQRQKSLKKLSLKQTLDFAKRLLKFYLIFWTSKRNSCMDGLINSTLEFDSNFLTKMNLISFGKICITSILKWSLLKRKKKKLQKHPNRPCKNTKILKETYEIISKK